MNLFEIKIVVTQLELKEIVIKRLHHQIHYRNYGVYSIDESKYELLKEYIEFLFDTNQIQEKEIDIDPYGFVDNLLFNYPECIYTDNEEYEEREEEFNASCSDERICEVYINGLLNYSLFKSKKHRAFLRVYKKLSRLVVYMV